MLLIPAIDMKEGRCVRLEQGDFARETVFSTDPVKQAVVWETAGAGMLHLVDLDGAAQGVPKNRELIEAICKRLKCPVQLGGGIRDMATAKSYLELGLSRIVLGTLLIKNPALAKEIAEAFPGKVLAGIDAKNGQVAGHGWLETSTLSATQLAQSLDDWPLAGIVYTDISRDGMMQGPNVEAIRVMAQATKHTVIASGGVSSIDDLRELATVAGVKEAIIGKAIYTGDIDLVEALKEFPC